MKYRKKPVVVEAFATEEPMDIETLEGVMHASAGDYIITGVEGERYPCKPDIFKKTYEPAKSARHTGCITMPADGCSSIPREDGQIGIMTGIALLKYARGYEVERAMCGMCRVHDVKNGLYALYDPVSGWSYRARFNPVSAKELERSGYAGLDFVRFTELVEEDLRTRKGF